GAGQLRPSMLVSTNRVAIRTPVCRGYGLRAPAATLGGVAATKRRVLATNTQGPSHITRVQQARASSYLCIFRVVGDRSRFVFRRSILFRPPLHFQGESGWFVRRNAACPRSLGSFHARTRSHLSIDRHLVWMR